MAPETPRLDTIFCAAIDIPAPEDRDAYIARACANDNDLRGHVEKLVAAHFRAGSFLEASDLRPVATVDAPLTERPGTVIGPYKLLEQIGEGGFGIVFMAEQAQPVRRKVALKILKLGMDTRHVVARFEAEQQALAIMDHPNIAKVHDGGATASGRPYFVMELVKGVPITEFCDQNHLTPRQRLELFIPICQAVQHAHQKGIIHRDLKPSNVLVTVHDTTPVPKIIDFGIAKALGQELTNKTLFTGFAQMIGTPLYMSPEQAGQSGLDIDTRSDIYSLGVLLYELLTGSTPFSKERFKQAAHDEIRRILREEDPPKPSTRLSELSSPQAPRDENKSSLASVAAQRQTEPAKLTKLMRGELDWIVMKTLEKDRNRRYETASAFAADVQRYLNDEPVQACPPSAMYRLRKFARQNKGPVAAGLALAALLVLGTVGTSIGLAWALRAERTATAAAAAEAQQRQDAETQRDRAQTAEKLATDRLIEVTKEKERATAAEMKAVASEADTKAFSDFLVNDVLAVARPKGERGGLGIGVTVKAALDTAAANIGERFRDRPRAEALARHDLGVTYRLIGQLDKSQEQLRLAYDLRTKALGTDDADTLNTGNSLAVLYGSQGHYSKAEPLFIKSLEVSRRVLGEEHPDTLRSIHNLEELYRAQGHDSKAEPLIIKALEARRRVLGEEHPDTLSSMNNLAELYREQGHDSKAGPLIIKALEVRRRVMGEEHPDTLNSMGSLGLLYRDQGHHSKAEPLMVKALEVRRRVMGEEHPDTLNSMGSLASLYQNQGQFAKAEPLYVKTLEARRRVLGEEHPDTLSSMNGLAGLYRAQGHDSKAEPLLVKAVEVIRRVLGEEHPKTLSFMSNLAELYRAQGQFAKAEPLLAKTLEVTRRVLGEEHSNTLGFMNNLATLYLAQGQFAKAEPLMVKALEVSRRVLGGEHPETLISMNNLAELYRTQGQFAKAEPLHVKTLEVSRRVLGEEHPRTLTSMNNLAVLYKDQGQFAKAEPLYVKALEGNRRVLGQEHPNTLQGILNLATLYGEQGQYPKAEPLFREAMEKTRKRHEEASPMVAGALAALGLNLLKQQKYADAEPLLRECLAIREQKLPEDWTTFNTKSMLGGSLLGQKKYADAEPLLLAGYEGMKARERTIPSVGKNRLIESLERLVQLYDAWGQKDKAEEWRKQLSVAKSANPPETKKKTKSP